MTFVEVILTLIVASLVAATTSQTMINIVDSYAKISSRRALVSDSRLGMNLMNREMRMLSTGTITNISDTSLFFVDENGRNTSFRLDVTRNGLGVYRGEDLLLDQVSEFRITYYSGDDQVVPAQSQNIPRVKKMGLRLVTDPVSKEGKVTFNTMVIPRDAIGYVGYQSE